jgi:DNA-directed RNA polymerase subunit M/transcription elongation factor TFIIS
MAGKMSLPSKVDNTGRTNPFLCKQCKGDTVWYTTDTTFDEAYDRYHYNCTRCKFTWIVVDESD